MQEVVSNMRKAIKGFGALTKQTRMTTAEFRALQSKIPGKKRREMNKTEAAYSDEVLAQLYIKDEIRDWWYESVRLRLANGAWYTPDFVVMMHDGTLEMHEVKGFWREAARVRIKVAADNYPFKFIAVQKLKKRDGRR